MYGFLSASLPVLAVGQAPGITLAEFDALAAAEMSAKKFAELISWDDDSSRKTEVYLQMQQFDDFLKWRIAGVRAERFGTIAENRESPAEFYGEIDFTMPGASASKDPAERERIIDRIRWQKIDDLELGHCFDFTYLCCYRLRLVMLEKYNRRAENNGEKLFSDSVNRITEVGHIDK